MHKRSMDITLASEEDYNGICKLFSDLDQHHVDLVPDRVRAYSGESRSFEQYLSYITGNDRALFLAKSGDVYVGFASLEAVTILEAQMHVGRSYAHIDNMYVAPEYRKAGVATSLLDAAVAWCKEHNISKLELQAYTANSEALKTYKSYGFSEFLTKMELQVNA